MEKSWWYANGDQKIGALSLDELLQHLVSEQINLKTLVWKQGWENWLKLTDAEEIRAQVLEIMRERQAKIPPPLPHETVAVALPPPVLSQQPPKLDALTSTPSNSPIVYAGFWQRVAALTLDNLVLLVFFIPASLLQVYGHNNEFAAFIALVASAIYFTKMESGESGATYGKRWIGIKVLDLEGRRLTKGRAFSRWIAHFLSYITLYIGYFIQPFTARKQALHDMVARTVLVQTDKAKASSGVVIAACMAIIVVFFVGIIAAIAIPVYKKHELKSKVGWTAIEGFQNDFVDYSKSSKNSEGYIVIPHLDNFEAQKSILNEYIWHSSLGEIAIDCEKNRAATLQKTLTNCTEPYGTGTCMKMDDEFRLAEDRMNELIAKVNARAGIYEPPEHKVKETDNYRTKFSLVTDKSPLKLVVDLVCGR